MIPQQTIDEILSLDIADVIGRHIELKQKGTNFQGSCPFHKEKTPSLSVSPAKNVFKCFGCGVSGNAISFVKELKKTDFVGAIKSIAEDFKIIIPQEEYDDKQKEVHKHRESMFTVNKLAAGFFTDSLKSNVKALEYVKSRWNDSAIDDFMIGYAPDGWDNLRTWARDNGIKEEILLEVGLLSEKNNKVYDYFRDRIIFPIINRTGLITGFTGRDFSGKEGTPKYFNTHDTEIYSKGKVLYGFNTAYRSIREHQYVHLVEGNPDVIRLQSIGKLNTVGTCGTSLTSDHIAEIAKYAKSITLIGDNDKAGVAAVIKNGKMIIEAGMFCNVIPLPDSTDTKNDPDSFFCDDKQFDTYATENIKDYIIWLAQRRQSKCKSPDLKTKLIDELSDLITHLPQSSHSVFVEQLSAIIKPKKAWLDRIKTIIQEDEPVKEDKAGWIPTHVSLSDWEKYGFYEENNCYFFRTKDGPKRGCNFTMDPLFHISSVMNAKRLYKITNEYGFSQVIELNQRDLITLAGFKLRVESLGNFLFEGSDMDLNKLKRFLYEKTQTCYEIVQLGWQKQGFWSWCHGIYNGKFQNADPNGIVMFEDRNYYLPASSEIYREEDTLFISERRFMFRPSDITLYDYCHRLIAVFGDNAKFAICFYMASLFRDHIAKLFGFFPILNLFGPKGAGKTELAISIMQFFGPQEKGPNITNTSKAALADHVALFSNACCHIDEYKNSLEMEKIEFLKGLWDGTGRTRMNMDKDKKKETTKVNVGIILSGQEIPTADIALYSRLLFLFFTKVVYSAQEKILFNELKDIEKLGISHLTHELLNFRSYFIQHFYENYNEASKELAIELKEDQIEDRIFRNWLVIIAAYRTLSNKISVPWEFTGLVKEAAKLIIRQNFEVKSRNEISQFWSIVEFLVQNGDIREEVDYKVDFVSMLTTDTIKEAEYSVPKNVLFMDHTRIFQFYRTHGKQSDMKVLPLPTLEYYLKNSKEYLGRKNSVGFKVEINKRIVEDTDSVAGIKKKRHVTTAMAFDYDALGISIINQNTMGQNDF